MRPIFTLFTASFRRTTDFLYRYPVRSFFFCLVLLFVVIALATKLRAPEEMASLPRPEIKQSAVFEVGRTMPYFPVEGSVRKESVIDVTALTPAVISTIFVKSGTVVQSGKVLLTLTSDYRSGAQGIRNEIAAKQTAQANEIADLEEKIVKLEKDIAQDSSTLTKDEKNSQLKQLKERRVNALANADIASLQEQLTRTNDGVLRPRIFSKGIVESVHVRVGETVTPGTPLVTIRTDHGTTTLDVALDARVAALFDPSVPSKVVLGGKEYTILPAYVPQSEGRDGFHTIQYNLSDDLAALATDGTSVVISLPLGNTAAILAPLDAIFQDGRSASLLVETDGKAESRSVVTGKVYGNYVEILSGLAQGERVVMNRSVIASDPVEIVE